MEFKNNKFPQTYDLKYPMKQLLTYKLIIFNKKSPKSSSLTSKLFILSQQNIQSQFKRYWFPFRIYYFSKFCRKGQPNLEKRENTQLILKNRKISCCLLIIKRLKWTVNAITFLLDSVNNFIWVMIFV